MIESVVGRYDSDFKILLLFEMYIIYGNGATMDSRVFFFDSLVVQHISQLDGKNCQGDLDSVPPSTVHFVLFPQDCMK
jgi:hypothetical protein